MTRAYVEDALRAVGLALCFALLVMVGALSARYVRYDNALPIYRPVRPVLEQSNAFDVGDHYDSYDVPDPGCIDDPRVVRCIGMLFTLKLDMRICIRFRDVWVRRADGTAVPFRVREEGEPGEPGYELNVETPGDASGTGHLIVHVRTDRCPGAA